jgi:hypothetical protein
VLRASRAPFKTLIGLLLPATALALLILCAPASASTTAASGYPSPLRAVAGEAAQPAEPVSIAINPFDPGRPVPQQFLGLSFEAAALHQLSLYSDRGDLVRLLRSLGPGVLRFGGITADENVAWTDAETPRPAWASSVIDEADLRAIGVLAGRPGALRTARRRTRGRGRSQRPWPLPRGRGDWQRA